MSLPDDADDVKPPLQIAHIRMDSWRLQQAQILTGHEGWQENAVTHPSNIANQCAQTFGQSVAL